MDLMMFIFFLFFKQKTAYEMRISDWSSDVCSSDLLIEGHVGRIAQDAYDLPKIRNAPHSFYQIAHRDRLVDKIRCDDKYCPHPLEGVIHAVEVEIVRDHRFAVGDAQPELIKFRGDRKRDETGKSGPVCDELGEHCII